MFEDRLSKLREEMNLNKKEVAKALNMPYTTYLNYENNEREPNSETLIQISQFFNVSIDYLLGISEVKTPDATVQQIHKSTGLTEKAIKNIQIFCLSSPFGMVHLNRLLEDLSSPYGENHSILYDIILYLHLVNAHPVNFGNWFALTSNNRIERINPKKEKNPNEITRISENEIIGQIILNRIIDSLKIKGTSSEIASTPNSDDVTNIIENFVSLQEAQGQIAANGHGVRSAKCPKALTDDEILDIIEKSQNPDSK